MNRRQFMASACAASLFPHSVFAQTPTLQPVAEGLDHPWGLAFLANNLALVSERSGTLRTISIEAGYISSPIAGLPDMYSEGQGGLLDIAIAPDFTKTREIFLSFSERYNKGIGTSVFKARLSDDLTSLENGQVIFRQNMTAGGGRHFGSRLVFDRYGHLFVTTGDRGTMSEEAQNPKSHIGKVLRITRQGTAAPGNPMLPDWAAEVWSLGHRNIQGAALHPQTQELWTVEHGARGGDELNLPKAGKNYGWPKITYGRDYSGAKIGEGTSASGLEQPVHYWDPSIAPSGMIFVTGNRYPSWTGDLLVGALAGEHIARLRLDKGKIVKEERLFEAFARFRSLAQAPDGWIYALTDNARPYGGLYRIVHSGS